MKPKSCPISMLIEKKYKFFEVLQTLYRERKEKCWTREIERGRRHKLRVQTEKSTLCKSFSSAAAYTCLQPPALFKLNDRTCVSAFTIYVWLYVLITKLSLWTQQCAFKEIFSEFQKNSIEWDCNELRIFILKSKSIWKKFCTVVETFQFVLNRYVRFLS